MQRIIIFENKKRFFFRILPCLLTILILCPNSALAVKRALLVGIGSYPHLSRQHQLEGPEHDVAVMKALFTGRYGFAENNVTVLLDEEAGKKEILGALDGLIEESGHGDRIYIYYSGHGTSAYDRRNRWRISPYTGALVPSDFTPRGTPGELMNSLIVGSRDIRPRLLQLERGRKVFVIIDACHSGLTVRSAVPAPGAKYRYVDIGSAMEGTAPMVWNPSLEKLPYPYSNTIYLAASSALEKAQDITSAALDHGLTTLDGKPHGAFSNSLLKALAGEADADGDGVLSIGEVFSSVRRDVMHHFGHTPQLLKPEGRGIDLSLFRHEGAQEAEGSVAEATDPDQGHSVPQSKVQQLLHLIEANTERFELSVTSDPAGGVLVEGTVFDIKVEAGEQAYVLLLGINSKGEISVIFPWRRDELVPVTSRAPLVLPEIGVVSGPDFGKEHLLALGFRNSNRLLKHLRQRIEQKSGEGSGMSFSDGRLFDELLEMARNREIEAFSILSVTTCGKGEVVKK